MLELFTYSVTVFTGFFAIMNPISKIPVFLSLCEGKTKKTKQRIAWKSCFTALLITVIFLIVGQTLFDIFHLTIPAFKITGGILIFYVGFEMLQSKKSEISHMKNLDEEDEDDDVAISPLAIPIMSGPGTIVTAMNYGTNANLIKTAIIIAVFTIIIVMTYICYRTSEWIMKKLGQNFITIIGKLMGLILAVLGTVMVIEGIKLAFNIPTTV